MISTLLELFWLFAKISVFSFGGGYVLIGFLQHELVSRNWISAVDFVNIVSISQMTPGPIAINAATFIGYKIDGLLGSVVATVAVVILPFILVIFISMFYDKYQSNPFVQNALKGIRPACAALIIIVGLNFMEMSVFTGKITDFFNGVTTVDIKSLLLFASVLIISARFKINSMWIFLGSMIIGIFLF